MSARDSTTTPDSGPMTHRDPFADGLLAGVLVGGASRRMGRPKHLLAHPAGGTFLEYAVGLTRVVTPRTVILGAGAELPPALAGLPRLADTVAGAGPLAGLCSLLAEARRGWALLLACDMPRLEVATLRALLDAVRGCPNPDSVEAVAFVETRGGRRRYHACCALYRATLGTCAQDVLHAAGGRMGALLERTRLLALTPSPAQITQLENVNTPEDYARIGSIS